MKRKFFLVNFYIDKFKAMMIILPHALRKYKDNPDETIPRLTILAIQISCEDITHPKKQHECRF